MRPSFPAEVCDECRADAPDHWLADFWWYCEHNRVMVRRRAQDPEWTVDRKVKPRKAEKHLTAAMAQMKVYAESQGYSMEEADELMMQIRKY